MDYDFDPATVAKIMKEEQDDAELDAMRVGRSVYEVIGDLPKRKKVRDKARKLYDKLKALGCILYVHHGSLQVEPKALVPTKLVPQIMELRRYMEEICDEEGTERNREGKYQV